MTVTVNQMTDHMVAYLIPERRRCEGPWDPRSSMTNCIGYTQSPGRLVKQQTKQLIPEITSDLLENLRLKHEKYSFTNFDELLEVMQMGESHMRSSVSQS